jgi:predicted CXXCH cytochrome family protein
MREARRPNFTWRRRPWFWATIAILALVGFWSGCSPEKDYKTLSIFFDGVPEPRAAKGGGTPGANGPGGGPAAVAIASHHKPFVEEKCASCHNSSQDIFSGGVISAAICLDCHKGTETQYAVMHGPVSAGACLWCHSPHESDQPKLLRAKSSVVCTQCHESGLLSTKVAEHTKAESECLSCHAGHGGPKRFLLREALAPTPPRTGVIK